jgi:hypothetical protein
MAAETILILGESGCGKSTSFRNLDPKETFIISTTSKPLPWRGWKKQYTKFNPKDNPDGNWYQTPKSAQITKIIKYVNAKRPEIRNIIIDDIQYAMSFEYMDRRSETGFQKFSDIGGDFTDMLRVADELRDDIKLIFSAHSENVGDAMNPHWTLKTVGKLVAEKITPEGLFTYVFHAIPQPGDGDRMSYKFLTNTDGEHVAKTSMGMFEDLYIDNDLNEIIKIINEYNEGE